MKGPNAIKPPASSDLKPFPGDRGLDLVREVLAHYENQTEDEQFAEIEAAREAEGTTLIAVPTELAPEVRALLPRKQIHTKFDEEQKR